MPITYSLITDGVELLGDGPKDDAALSSLIMDKIVKKVSKDTMEKRTLTSDEIEIHYKKSGNYVFFCVASKDTKKRLCWSFIDDLDSTFAAVTRKNDIKGNRKMIKQKVEKWNDPNADKITALQEKLETVKESMVDNIDKVLERGEKFETLYEKSDEMLVEANEFKKGSGKLKRKMFWRLLVVIIVIIIILVAIIIIAVLAGCGFPTFERCGGGSGK
ncbi:hypothetical protein FDP41_005622 [Naegleria fowleri]|uniref:V-SNARE coiled-coil homology domain-containing protein n=1 Tax=Naegleria fowleri TaxID=5763 RepID=A0A6A5BNA3_NAEFO|nr:uncharacterized protein FDP41_005622 [Naegleria fowleri]KAF0975628.1 hypothetical protein FDP41_005622 [Naegleria fowleri]CAG4717239.1 unnamed protein product [Naegleria fowleri]